MRILWDSAAPWEPTGYGTQTGIWTQRLRDAGHTVAISCYHGIQGTGTTWRGIDVYPASFSGGPHATQTFLGHIEHFKPDVIIMLRDVWVLNPQPFARIDPKIKVLAWTAIDTQAPSIPDPPPGLSLGDTLFFKTSQVKPIAMTQAGQRTLASAGIDAPWIPHGIDTVTFRPPVDKPTVRYAFGLEQDTFAVGMNVNNIDPWRKAIPEQMQAFALFRAKHPDSVLFIHSVDQEQDSLHLELLARTLRIQDYVRLSDQYRMQTGTFTAEDMAAWYGCLDVLMNATRGEGFGIPAIEAQACGVPVILSDNTSGPELVGPGWLVPGQDFWNKTHAACWQTPSIPHLADRLEKARKAKYASPFKSEACRLNAEKYDIERVWPLWAELLESL